MWDCEPNSWPALPRIACVQHARRRILYFKLRKFTMTKNQIQGIAKTFLGGLLEFIGKLLDDKPMRMRGLRMQVIGYADQAIARPRIGERGAAR